MRGEIKSVAVGRIGRGAPGGVPAAYYSTTEQSLHSICHGQGHC